MIGEINKNLKSRMVEIYGSQKQFAHENSIPEGTVSRVIRGRFNLTAEEQILWAKALDTTPQELFAN